MVLCLTISVRLEALLGGRRCDHFEHGVKFDIDLELEMRLSRNYLKIVRICDTFQEIPKVFQ